MRLLMYLRLRNFEMFEFHFLVLTQACSLFPVPLQNWQLSAIHRNPVTCLFLSPVSLSTAQKSVHMVGPCFQIITIFMSEVPVSKLYWVAGNSD